MTFLARLLGGLLLLVLFSGTVLAVDGDVVFKREGPETGTPPAVFPHWIHRMAYTCYACHETPFKMKKGANEVTMDMIQSGQSCGACHDGHTAFESSLTSCNRCHR